MADPDWQHFFTLQAFFKPSGSLWKEFRAEIPWLSLSQVEARKISSPFPTSRINKPRLLRKLRNSIFNSNADELYQIHLCSFQIYWVILNNTTAVPWIQERVAMIARTFHGTSGFFPKLLGCGATRPNKCGGCEGAPGGCQLCNGAAGCAQSPGRGAGRKGSLRMAKPLTVQCQQTCSHDTNGLQRKMTRKPWFFSHEIRGFLVMFPFN